MLIFLSDFHLMDGTAGTHHVEAATFRSAFNDLAAFAREARAADIKIVLLGDLYDLIRTERWFEFHPDDRPWGAHPSEEIALEIMNGVIAENAETFEILAGPLGEQFDFPAEPELVYVPGNHDRLCNVYPSLRRRVRESLGLPQSDAPFEHAVLDPEHGVLARHGQEWDPFNFEGSDALRSDRYGVVPLEDYGRTPIGDVIAAEMASRVPVLARELLPESHPHRDRMIERLRHLFDVRPLVGMIEWLGYQVSGYDKTVQQAISKALNQAARDFNRIPFTRQWIQKHDRFGDPFDEADRLQMLMSLVGSFKSSRFNKPLAAADRFAALSSEKYVQRALEDFRRLDAVDDLRDRILYVLYGHTHGPGQHALDVLGEAPNERYRLYVNTGTWRPTHHQSATRRGFVSWQSLTYTLLYRAGELGAGGTALQYPALESWTGTIVAGRGRRATTLGRLKTLRGPELVENRP